MTDYRDATDFIIGNLKTYIEWLEEELLDASPNVLCDVVFNNTSDWCESECDNMRPECLRKCYEICVEQNQTHDLRTGTHGVCSEQVTGKLKNVENTCVSEDCERAKENKSKLDSDIISRQAATSIPILPKEHRKPFKDVDDAFETGWNEALSCVNMLPSADRPTGHIVTSGIYPTVWAECSECGKPIDSWDKFCRHCGAYMRGE